MAGNFNPTSASDKTLWFTTCELSDALIKQGVKNGGYIPDLEVFSPAPSALPSVPGPDTDIAPGFFSMWGPAFTVRIVDAQQEDAPPKMEGHFVDKIETGSVVVIEAPSHLKNAVWGGLMTAGAQARGARGVVISGRCRDLSEHRAAGFPVFARGHSIVGSQGFARATHVQVPIQIEPIFQSQDEASANRSFPGLTVRPGDWIVADVDGVVCIPHELIASTWELATKGREIDAHCLEDIKAGKGVEASFAKYRGK